MLFNGSTALVPVADVTGVVDVVDVVVVVVVAVEGVAVVDVAVDAAGVVIVGHFLSLSLSQS